MDDIRQSAVPLGLESLIAGKAYVSEKIRLRIVSTPALDIFEGEPQEHRDTVLPPDIKPCLCAICEQGLLMKSLKDVLQHAESDRVAVGHFNFSDLVAFNAIAAAARALNLPVMVGVSEGERAFVGVRQAAALVRSIGEEYGQAIFP